MPKYHAPPTWASLVAILLLTALLGGCGSTPEERPAPGTWLGRPVGAAPAPNPVVKQGIVNRAVREWEFFGRQTIVFNGNDESIPHVGAWEDDNELYSARVGAYWRASGKSGLDGMDCKEPWSAAFISFVMQGAGVPDTQIQRAPSHSQYIAGVIDQAPYPGRWYVPRRVTDYSPNPGDLICAGRNGSRPAMVGGYVSAAGVRGRSTHCDLVVAKAGANLETVGGNVRNSVSRTTFPLDAGGRLKPLNRRPWFVILENRL